MNWTLEEIPKLRGYCVEWAEPGKYYLSRRNEILHSENLEAPFKKIAIVAAPSWKTLASNFRLPQRLLRFMVTNVVPLGNGDLFVTFDKSVGIIRNGEYKHLLGLKRPCRVLRGACALDDKGSIFFGEYLANTERGPMRVYRYRTGDDAVKVVHTFPPGSIRHVHGLYYDRHTESVFCLTGDDERECQMLATSDEFATVQTIGSGDETWRAVSMLFSEDSIFYGTDAEFRENNIFRLERTTGERHDLGTVNGTVFYSIQIAGDLFFTTTAENAPSQVKNAAGLWKVSNDECRQLASFKKDVWPTALFQFGTIHFPYANKLTNELYFQLVAVKGDSHTFRAVRQST